MTRPICPECNSTNAAAILYGTPFFNEELERMLREGKIVLGGTTSGGFDSPEWHCNNCGARWRASGASPSSSVRPVAAEATESESPGP